MAYRRLHYHLVWATHRRTPWLTGESTRIVEAAIRTKVRQLGGITHAVGVMPDHVHVAASLPPGIALSNMIGQAKGLSSFLVAERLPELAEAGFRWQGSFGVTSISQTSLPQLIDYVNNQETRHQDQSVYDGLERTDVVRPPRRPAMPPKPVDPGPTG